MAIEDAKPEHRPPGLEGPHVRPEGDTAQRTWQARTDVCTTPASAPDGYPSGDHGRGHGVARSGAQAYYGCGKNQHDDRPAAYNTAAAAESLRHLACEIIQLCDANPTGAVLCANLPRQYKKRFRKVLDFKQLDPVLVDAPMTQQSYVRAQVRIPQDVSTTGETPRHPLRGHAPR